MTGEMTRGEGARRQVVCRNRDAEEGMGKKRTETQRLRIILPPVPPVPPVPPLART